MNHMGKHGGKSSKTSHWFDATEWHQAILLEDDADLDLAEGKDLNLRFLADVLSGWDLLYHGIINTASEV